MFFKLTVIISSFLSLANTLALPISGGDLMHLLMMWQHLKQRTKNSHERNTYIGFQLITVLFWEVQLIEKGKQDESMPCHQLPQWQMM